MATETRTRISRRNLLLGGAAVAAGAGAIGYAVMSRPKSATAAQKEAALAENFRAVPFWWDELGVAPPPQGELLDTVDFLVVGAGFAGLSAGRTLAAHGGKVMIVDAEHPYYGASSRNCGFFGQAYEGGTDPSTPEGRATYEEFRESNDYLRQLMAEDQIDAVVRNGRYHAASHESHLAGMKEHAKKIHDVFKYPYEIVEPADSAKFFNSPTAVHGGLYMPDAPYLQPARLAHGNYLGAVRKGAHVVGKTRVTDIEREAGGLYAVTTSRGKILAKHVLLAVGGYGAPGFAPLNNVVPVKSYLIATPPLTPAQMASVWERPLSMKNSKFNFNIVIPSPDGKQLLINGRTGVRYDSLESMAVDLCKVARELLPQLGEIRATHAWEGVFGMTYDYAKHLFRDDEGVVYLNGDNGSGVGKLQWLGHKTALQMLGLAEGDTVLARIGPPPMFPGYVARSDWFVPGAVAFYDMRDKYDL